LKQKRAWRSKIVLFFAWDPDEEHGIFFMPDSQVSSQPRYFLGVCAAALAFLFLILFPFPSSAGVYLLFLSMVLVSAWQGGLGPGLLTTLLAVLGAGWLVFGPLNLIPRGGADEINLGVFAGIGLLASWLLGSVRNEQRRALLGSRRMAQFEKEELLAQEWAAREELLFALRITERRYRSLVETTTQVVWTTDANGQIISDIPGWRSLTGKTFDQIRDRGWLDDVHPDDRVRVARQWKQAVKKKGVYNIEYRIRLRDGSYRYFAVRGVPLFDPQGKVLEWFGTCTDIHDRKQGELGQKFLERAGHILTSSLDYQTRLEQLTRLAVPSLGDCCYVHIVQPDGTVRLLAEADVKPNRAKIAWELERRFPVTTDAPHGLARVLRTGQPILFQDIDRKLLRSVSCNSEHEAILRKLGWRSCMAHSLIAQGRVFGTLLFCSIESRHRYNQSDLALGGELARRASVALENARLYGEARQAAQAKDQFLAMLAHELRNPLAPILNSLQILESEPLSDKGREVRDIAVRQVGHMARLIDDLLDVARITRGQIFLHKEIVDLNSIVRRAMETVQPMAEEMGLSLNLHLPEQTIRLEADPTRLDQILGNLLQNAVKYTGPGGCIDLNAQTYDDQMVLIVKDTGIGIDAEVLPHVFDLFAQADKSLDRARGGLGIGLTLVRRLVELHGGRIEARSPGPGKGSEFEVRLPILGSDSIESERPDETPEFRDGLCRRVLIVDDNADAAHSLALLLRVWGNEVSVAHDGPEALESVKAQKPEVIFLDIGLPGMDGYQVARRLRELEDVNISLLVAMTGYGQEEDRSRSREAGFDRHLVKPVEPETIRDLLAKP
jgi:PAS domain S-box-containing protein